MTTSKKRIVTAIAVLLAGLLGISGFIYFMQRRIADQVGKAIAEQIFVPHATEKVNTQAWARLQVGMTQNRVIEILGDVPHKMSKSDASQKDTKADLDRLEFWEYNYTYGMFGPPHPKAYVIYFDQHERVTSFRGPADENSTGGTALK